MSEPAIVWPEVGSAWRDSRSPDRRLIVTDVNPKDGLQRHVVGLVDGRSYSCAITTFEIVWRREQT